MLAAHMDAVEASLLQTSRIPANSGHTLHRGTPREAFIRQFLESHLSANVTIGTGEIIDANSTPRAPRNQFDIVIYKKNYPKLDFGGGVSGFMIESVVATIEVKSLLDQAAIDQSVRAASNAKGLTPNITKSFSTGWIPPKILNFVVAYDGPAQMSTAHGWILNSHTSLGIPLPAWTQQTKVNTPGTALDGVFLLQKGFIKLDNSPLSLNSGVNPLPGIHVVCDSPTGNLLMLFLFLQEACNNIEGAWLNPIPYVQTVRYPQVRVI
ncbi:hypothetical protein LJ655_28800 [Paraburkholderia sp. MMS20-SJTN17]|uniref:DUF6602 domain-containing protein n=1 Tax=Paraburkholderia translucens TaxID=2886945 RepID=A0ABS8KM19_9BURK|nr:DUF6602 domain-containing protein [Paraburkholderia sp. MMS20-SJTN17]MCC8405808.1 hypothetical protein [Paraburkholderia sp. MMS20-SJTN17]